MDVLIFLVVALVLFGAGYAFRGMIGREVSALGEVLKNDRDKLVTTFNTDRTEIVSYFENEIAKVKAEAKKL